MRQRVDLFLLSFLLCSVLVAQSGALPRGPAKEKAAEPAASGTLPTPKAATPAKEKTPQTPATSPPSTSSTLSSTSTAIGTKEVVSDPKVLEMLPCQEVFATVRGGEGFFPREGQMFYFVSRPPAGVKAGDEFYELYSYEIQTGKLNRMFGVQLADSLNFVGQGFPIDALGIYNFKDYGPECLQGFGNIQSLIILNQKQPKLSLVFPEGHYSILHGTRSFALYDGNDGAIKEYDLVSGQKRSIVKFKEDSLPFLYDKTRGQLLTYRTTDKGIMIKSLGLPTLKTLASTVLPSQTRVLIDGDRIAFLTQEVNNEVVIRELKSFNSSADLMHKIALPKGYDAIEAGYVANLEKHLIGVTAYKQEKRKRWTRSFLMDYLEKKILTVQKIPEKHYISSTYFHPTGSLWISIIKDDNNRLSGLSVYNIATRTWFSPKLPK